MTYDIVPGRPGAGRTGAGANERTTHQVYEVGDFHQGDQASRWILRRYLIARALGSSVLMTATAVVVLLAALTVGIWMTGVHWLAVLIGIVTLFALLGRALLSRLVHWLSGAGQLGGAEPRVAKLVGRTRRGLRRELRHSGLPGGMFAPLAIARRLADRDRRDATIARISAIDLGKVVSATELDELHLLLRSAPRR